MAPKKDTATCLACHKPFGKEVSIQCVICGLKVHYKPCSAVTKDGFKYLEDMIKATGAAYWACRSCVAYSQGITQKVKAVEKEIENIKTDVKANKEGVKNSEATVEELKRQVEKNKSDIENVVMAAERRMGSEWREHEKRKKNVIVHRLPEPGDDLRTADERRQQDRANCGQLFGQIGLGELEHEIKTCRRLGERGRPLIVLMKSEEAKRKLLDNAYR